MNCKTAVHAPTILSNCMTLLAVSSDICCCKKATPTVAMTVKLIISGVCIGELYEKGWENRAGQTSHLEPNVACEFKFCDMLTVELQTYFTDIVSRLF